MKTINKPFVVSCIALAFCGRTITSAQPLISITRDDSGKSRTFLAGQISPGADIQAFETKAFTCTPVQPLKKSDILAASVSDDQAWSVGKQSLQVGTSQVDYPTMATVKCSDGFHAVFPVILKIKNDIKVGGTLNSDGYQITTKRAVKAGDSISVLFIGDSLLSVEGGEGAKPWFTAYKDGVKESECAARIEAWQLENGHVGFNQNENVALNQDSSKQIHEAAGAGDLGKVQALLNDNPDLVSRKDKYGKTPLHQAADGGHKVMVELLLANHTDVNSKDNNGWTPLHWAAFKRHKEVAKSLLANKADVNAKDNHGSTPLYVAAFFYSKDVAELLLANKAEVNAKNNVGITPLHQAAQTGYNKGLVELLLANRADVNAKDNNGQTPLHFAMRANSKDMVELLLANKADVNAKDNNGQTPLHYLTTIHGPEDLVELLRQQGGHE